MLLTEADAGQVQESGLEVDVGVSGYVLWKKKKNGPRGTRALWLQQATAAEGRGHWPVASLGGGGGWEVHVKVGAECESEKEEESGAKPHHKQSLHCVTHSSIKS